MEKFYKLAKPDGWDFYSEKTINYRNNVGRTVVCPEFDAKGELCSSAFIHASRNPDDCFIGAKIPCSAYLVRGKPIKEDKRKCGFKKLFIEEELEPENLFKWRYAEAVNPIYPFKVTPPEKITKKHLKMLKEWASVKDSVGDVWDLVEDSVGVSVKDSVGLSIGDSVWVSVRDLVKDSVGDSVWVSVGDSVWNLVWVYIGYIFSPCVKKWRYLQKKGKYPFQSGIDLWKLGLVPSFDGKLWRLHGGEEAEVLWEGKI